MLLVVIRHTGLLSLLVALVCGFGCTGYRASYASGRVDAAEQEGLVLTLGVYQTDLASVMYQKFKPIANELQRLIGTETGRPTTIHLRIFKTYDDGLQALVNGHVDFARFGPASYLKAKQLNDGIRLLAMEHEAGKKRSRGVIVVSEDSPIHVLADLKSRTFAFGDKYSTVGRFLSQAELVQVGIHAKDLAGIAYLDRHDKVAKAVAIGDYDAGAIKGNTLRRFNTNGQLRVIHSFENVTRPWIARSGMDSDVENLLRQALLNMVSPEPLEVLHVDGFLPASDEDFELVVTGMQTALAFEE